MNKKDLAKLALIGMASGYCLTADAKSTIDQGMQIAMHKAGAHSDTCTGPGGCREGTMKNNKVKKENGGYGNDDYSGEHDGYSGEDEASCGGNGGCGGDHSGQLDQGEDADMAGRRRKAAKVKVDPNDRFVGEMDEAGRKIRRKIEKEPAPEKTDRFLTKLDKNGRILRVTEEKQDEDEVEYGYDAAGRWRQVPKE